MYNTVKNLHVTIFIFMFLLKCGTWAFGYQTINTGTNSITQQTRHDQLGRAPFLNYSICMAAHFTKVNLFLFQQNFFFLP